MVNESEIERKNVLLGVLTREITQRGNYLNLDGQSLSIKHFLKDWESTMKNESLIDKSYHYLNQYQHAIQRAAGDHVPGKNPHVYSRFGTGRVYLDEQKMVKSSHPLEALFGKPSELGKKSHLCQRFAESFQQHNMNPSGLHTLQIEYFDNLKGGHGLNFTNEITKPAHLFDFQELDDLLDLEKKTNGFENVQKSGSPSPLSKLKRENSSRPSLASPTMAKQFELNKKSLEKAAAAQSPDVRSPQSKKDSRRTKR